MITGDVPHHPAQLAEVDWVDVGDFDPVLATVTRRAFLKAIDGRRVLVVGTHFAGPTAGHAVRDGRGWRFDPV